MTLSFVTRWRDELPETYTALSPTPLNNARLIWHNTELANTLSIPSSLFKNGAGVWGGEALLPGMSPLAQVYSGHQFEGAVRDLQLPRETKQQASIGTQIDKDELLPGDLVFFKTGSGQNGLHVGIYDTNNQFIHASTSKGVMRSSLDNVYWQKNFWQARRI